MTIITAGTWIHGGDKHETCRVIYSIFGSRNRYHPVFNRLSHHFISGPLLDRIDIQVEIEPVAFDDIADKAPAESSVSIRDRVMKARTIQQERYRNLPGIHCNAQMNSRLLHEYAWPDEEGLSKLKERMTRLNMSARAFDRILRVARTIADLDSSERVESRHIAEAIGYRSLDRASYGKTF